MNLLKRWLLTLLLTFQLWGAGAYITTNVSDEGVINTPSILSLSVPVAHGADIPTGEYSVEDSQGEIDSISDEPSFRKFMLKVMNFFLSFLGIVAVAMVIYGGYLFVISNGDDAQKEKGTKIVLYACIGIIIILGSYALINTILENAGRGTDDREGTGRGGIAGGGYGTINRLINPFWLIGTGSVGRKNDGVGAGFGTEAGSLTVAFAGGGFCFNDDGTLDFSKIGDQRCKDLFGLNTYRVGRCFTLEGLLLQPLPRECEDLVKNNTYNGGQCFDENGFILPPNQRPDACSDLFEENTEKIGDCFDADGFLLQDKPGCEDYFKENTVKFGDCFNQSGAPDVTLPGCGHLFNPNQQVGGELCYDADGKFIPGRDCGRKNPGSSGPGLGGSIENPIRVSGNDVNDFGNGVVVPLETARGEGVEITLETDGRAEVDFGDGTKVFHDTVGGSQKTLPDKKRYGQKGVYNLKARVETSEGVIQNFQKQIIVGGATADIIGNVANVRVGDKVAFSGLRSSASAGTITDYQWNCEGATGCFASKDTQDIEVVFSEPGDYTVILDVESSIGAKDRASVNLTVKANKPVAAFEFESTGNDRKPAEYRFDAGKSIDTEGNNKGLLFIWDFDGDIVETYDRVTIYEFPSSGEKTVKLRVKQSDGSRNLESDPETDTEAQKTLTVETIVGCEVLVENESILGIASPNIFRGKRTRFEVKSAQASNFEWQFSGIDGGTSTQIDRVAYFTYEDAADNVTVGLRAFDDITDDEQDCGFILRVLNQGKPTAIIDLKIADETIYQDRVTITRGETITFGSLSVDDSGNRDTSNLRETWRVNGRVVRDTGEISQFFKKTGDYTIQLIAANKDDANIRDTDEVVISVVNANPEVTSVTSFEDGRLGLRNVKVEAIASDIDGKIERYTFQVINAETGGVELGQSRKENFAFFNLTQFPGRFQYRFRVIVTDNDGGTGESTTDMEESTGIQIDNFPPKVSIYLTPSNAGTLDTIFTFVGQATDEDGDALTYLWNFPNDTWVEETRNYRFIDIGTYVISLTVSDGLDDVTVDVEVIVEEKLEDFDDTPNTPPSAEIHAILPSTKVPVNTPVYFYSRGNDVDGDVLTYEWDLGDGNRTQVQHTIHTYVNEGSYSVSLTASDGLETVVDQKTIEVVSAEEAETLSPEVRRFLQNKYENNGEPLTPQEKAELLVSLENQVEIGTYQNYDNLTQQEKDDIENSEKLGSYTNLKNLNQQEQDRLTNLLNSEVGSYTTFDDLTRDEQKNLQNALELGTYKDFQNLSYQEREAITNLVATGDYKNFDDLNETEKRALENILRTGTYKYLTEMDGQEIRELQNDLEGGTYGDMTDAEIKQLVNKLQTGSYGQLTAAEWKILQNKALFNGRTGIDMEALKNKGYATRAGTLDLDKLQNGGYITAQGTVDLAALRNGGLITDTGEIDLKSLQNRGFVDMDGNLDIEELRNRGFVNARNEVDLAALRNPVLLGYGSQGLPNMKVDIEDNAFVYTQIKPNIDAYKDRCRQEIAKAADATERQRLQKICDELETQEKRTIDTLAAIDILKLEAMIEEDPFLKHQLEKRIANIESELQDPSDFEFVSIGGNPSTTFFLYGVAPDDYPRALSFEWDMGDGRKMYGQNVSVQYDKPGIYRITFTVSDGELEVSDFLRIHVLNSQPQPPVEVESEDPNDL